MFKYIDINSKSELEPYFKLVDYEASEYCFSTIYMWRHLFNTKCYIENDFAIILLEYEKNVFSIKILFLENCIDLFQNVLYNGLNVDKVQSKKGRNLL